MADFAARVPENVAGPYFVDESCIDCDTCRCISPSNFRRSEEHGYSYVYHQPSTQEEYQLAEEALECCPVGAIGEATEAATQEILPSKVHATSKQTERANGFGGH